VGRGFVVFVYPQLTVSQKR